MKPYRYKPFNKPCTTFVNSEQPPTPPTNDPLPPEPTTLALALARVADVPQVAYPDPVPFTVQVAEEGTQPIATTTKAYYCPSCGAELLLG